MNKIRKYIPIIDTIQNYNVKMAKRDIISALTVAVIGVPQAMAYAMIAGLNPIYGIYTGILSPIIGSIFGSSNYLICGTTNTMSLLLASALASYVGAESFYEIVFLLTFLVGATQILLGVFKFGKLINYVSHTVIVGFISGAAVIISLGQLKSFLGVTLPTGLGSTIVKTGYILSHLSEFTANNIYAIAVGVLTILIIIITKKINKSLPSPLIAIVITSLLCILISNNGLGIDALKDLSIKIVGEIPKGLPKFKMFAFDFKLIPGLMGSVITLAIIGLVEAMSIGKSIADKAGDSLDSNQEFIAQGLSKLIPSFFQCFSSSGSLTRSAVNFYSGAASRMSGILSGVFIALILLFFGTFAQYIPIPTLAGIIMLTAYNMIDTKEIKKVFKIKGSDKIVFLTTAISTIVLPEISWAIYLGIILSLVLHLNNSSTLKIHVRKPEHIADHTIFTEHNIDDIYENNDILLLQIEGTLYFGSSGELGEQLAKVADKAEIYILRMKQVQSLDMTAAQTLETFIIELISRDEKVIICGMNHNVHNILKRTNIENLVGEDNIIESSGKVHNASIIAYKKAEKMLIQG